MWSGLPADVFRVHPYQQPRFIFGQNFLDFLPEQSIKNIARQQGKCVAGRS